MDNERENKWFQEKYGWMSDDQYDCYKMLCDIVGGSHHLCGTIKPWGRGIIYNTAQGYWATWDFNWLTKLVVLAHDRLIRVDIGSNPGPDRYKFCLWKRHKRKGRMSERHPNIEEAINIIRDKEPK